MNQINKFDKAAALARLPELKGADLVDLHNELVQLTGNGREVARFSDAATARKRIARLMTFLPEGAATSQQVPAPARRTNAGPAISASWQRMEVRDARVTRHKVSVDGVEFRSVRAAFAALGLPMGRHIPFRARLKAAGTVRDEAGRQWVLGEEV